MRRRVINSIRNIDGSTQEGKLLILAIGRLMSVDGYGDKGPDQILAMLSGIAAKIDKAEGIRPIP